MGTTSEFLKLRSSGSPKVGEWNDDYKAALAQAKKENKFIVTAWSNGDACSYCVAAEKCMMTDTFKNWMKTSDAYFVFKCSDDKDKGQDIYDWIFKNTGVKFYPGFRITLYDPSTGKIVVNKATDGNTLRNKKVNEYGAKAMISNLEAIFAKRPSAKPIPEKDESKTEEKYKVRFNEKLTVAKINKVLDALDNNDDYCPCQPKDEGTKCHCEDFVNNKKIDEPCICKIYVKKSLNAKTSKLKVKPRKAKAKTRK